MKRCSLTTEQGLKLFGRTLWGPVEIPDGVIVQNVTVEDVRREFGRAVDRRNSKHGDGSGHGLLPGYTYADLDAYLPKFLSRITTRPEKYFLDIVRPDGEVERDPCYLLKGSGEDGLTPGDRDGYGQVHFKSRSSGRSAVWQAHRYAWAVTHGPVPDGLEILHKCHNRGCVKHLRVGSKADNAADRVERNKAIRAVA